MYPNFAGLNGFIPGDGDTARGQEFSLRSGLRGLYGEGAQGAYARGGLVTGAPGATGAYMTPAQMEQHLNDFQRRNPQAIAQIKQALLAGVQAGEISFEDLNLAGQLAMVALQNPEMYPYVRQFAAQRGLVEAQMLPEQYDQGLVFVLVSGTPMGQGGTGTPMGQVSIGSAAATGGAVKGPGTGTSDSIPIRVSNGEYVIPAHVVAMKGREFFDALLEKYRDVPKDG